MRYEYGSCKDIKLLRVQFFRKTNKLRVIFKSEKSLIIQHRKDLILGLACEADQIYREISQGKSDEELKDIVDFYDYLEIQPAQNNAFMVRKGTVKDVKEIININKRVWEFGEKNNKSVVATCDVHF